MTGYLCITRYGWDRGVRSNVNMVGRDPQKGRLKGPGGKMLTLQEKCIPCHLE